MSETMGKINSKTENKVRQKQKENKKVKKRDMSVSDRNKKKLDKTNGPSATACWMDASRQARDNLYCIRTVHQPSNIT